MTGAIGAEANRRTRGAAAMVEGFFAIMWFSWGQGSAPAWLNVPVLIGTVAGIVAVVAGLVVTLRSTSHDAAMRDAAVRRRYNIIVGLEFAILAAGAALLGATGLTRWIIVWAGAVVGVHFVPLASVFRGLHLVPIGCLIVAVAVASLIVGTATSGAPGAVAGLGTAVCLLAAAFVHLSTRS
jgi:hypothetical protein